MPVNVYHNMFRFICVLSLSASLLFSCKKEATRWQSNWNAPLIQDSLSLKNLVNDSTLSIDLLGNYELALERTLFDLNVADLVQIPDTTIVEVFTIAVQSLTLAPGFSFINSAEEHDLYVPNGVQLKKILLDEGYIDVKLENPVATKTIFSVTLPGVVKNGQVFNQVYTAPAGSQTNPGLIHQTIDLSGYEIDLMGLSGASWNTLQSQITVSTDPLGPSVVITDEDETKIFATFRDVRIAYAQGFFGQQVIEDTSSFNLDELNSYAGGSLDLPSMALAFDIENGLKVGAKGTLHYVKNTNSAGNQVSLSSPQIGVGFTVDPATGNWGSLSPSYETLSFTSSNSSIEQYMENLGNVHEVAYRFELNPWGNVSGGWDEIFPQSRLRVKLKADMPLTIGMDGLTLRDTFTVNIDQDPDKTRILSGLLRMKAKNAFPLGAKINLFLLDENGTSLHMIPASSDLISSLYGSTDPNTGLKVQSSELEFIITEAIAKSFNDVRSIAVEVILNTPDPLTGNSQPQQIPAGAFVSLKLFAELVTENVVK